MSKPTPGPWTYMYDADEDHAVFSGNKMIAIATGTEVAGSREQDEANARLIAAAPEMLQALEYVVQVRKIECSAHPEGFDDICAYCKIRAAISKATGGAL